MQPTVSDNKLSAVSLGIKSIDGGISADCLGQAPSITSLDLSFNDLATVVGLEKFRNVETLILDNNRLTSLEGFPDLPRLSTLWLNKNDLIDIEAVLNTIAKRCPRLTYLSLLGNPCCTNELNGNAMAEYSRLRLYIVYRVPTLKFLDAMPVTADEVKEARLQGSHTRVIRVGGAQSSAQPQAEDNDVQQGTSATAVPPQFFKDDPSREGRHATYFSYQRQQYSGKSSEGNRFIKDDKL
eukprot:PhM_4_TR4492/c0_g1_i1/m.9083